MRDLFGDEIKEARISSRVESETSPLVVAWGAGTDSTAMLVGMNERGVRPDLVLFADTGGEKPRTYEYIDIFQQWLSRNGFPQAVIVKKTGRTLEEECLDAEMLPSVAYGYKSCSDKWKKRPQNAFVAQWQPAIDCWANGFLVRKAIGYDAGPRDQARATIANDSRYQYIYPLIEWGWTRKECEQAIHRAGLPLPGKSACFFCPAMKKWEILQLRDNHPELLSRAIEMESNAKLQTIKGLGRNWAWVSFLQSDADQQRLFPDQPDIQCMCSP